MDKVPRKGVYKCPVHGLFIHDLNGVVLPWTNCPIECLSMGAGSDNFVKVACGLRSPLASQDLVDLDKRVEGMDDKTWDEFKSQILRMREEEAATQQMVSTSMYGKRFRSLGEQLADKIKAAGEAVEAKQRAEDIRVAREMYEAIERERMRIAMAQAGIEVSGIEAN